MHPSISEDNGVAALTEQDKRVYSVGISSAAVAEIRMATASPTRRIIATTIDPGGIKFATKKIQDAGLLEQIEVKLEDIAAPLPYSEGSFDFVYARLVLHYLPRNSLIQALKELHRVLKSTGKIFIVVRSTGCDAAKSNSSILDSTTGMTTHTTGGTSYSRYFHSPESIQNYLISAGFQIENLRTYEELLCVDFQRTQPAEQKDPLIEVLARKWTAQ